MKNEIELSKTYWASVSGGKDSLYMLAHILHNLDKYPLDGVVHFELEIDYPFIKNVIDYMERECTRYGIPFIRIKPQKSWFELLEKYGYPTRTYRWCNSKYKMTCRHQLDELMKKQNKKVICYIGYCANEVNRVDKRKNNDEIYPLYEMGVYEETIWNWAKKQTIFNDYYKYNKRCGCYNCPMQHMHNTKYNSVYYPDLYNEYMSLAEKSEKLMEKKQSKPFSVWQGNPKYNTAYRRQRIEQMELKEIERW